MTRIALIALLGLAAALAAPAEPRAQKSGETAGETVGETASESGGETAGETAVRPLLGDRPGPSSAELLPGWPTARGDRVAGLTIRVEAGWKTYWRAPGDSGIPPVFDWSGSENVAAVEVDWPRPDVFTSFGMRTIGYRRDVTLPLRVDVRDPDRPVRLRLDLDYGVCADICVPEEARLALDIAPGARSETPALLAATRSLPRPARKAGLQSAECRIAGAGAERRFEGAFRFEPGFDAPPVVVVEGRGEIWFAPAEATLSGDDVTVEAEVRLAAPDAWIDRSALRVTFLTPTEALDLRGCAG